ncbi:uncharacterized protein [Ptychodera flava]|uniref:uncharacterized protein isoform X2 n=1 Tax=Ptychodera flava TaxID=63121 RepID=UPI00396A5DEF
MTSTSTSTAEGQRQSNEDQTTDIRTLAVDFANNTTAHGIPRVVGTQNKCGRSSWILIVVAALAVLSYQITLLIVQYSEFNVNVKVELISGKQIEFPTVTVCNTNKLRRSAVRESVYKEMLFMENDIVAPYYIPCIDGDYLCADGIHCIKPYLRCDGVNNCGDMSDEDSCNYYQCDETQFRCHSGSDLGICINEDLRCDQYKDCYGGEDEDDCECDPETTFQCLVSRECVDKIVVCDKVYDCRDASDESNMCIPDVSNVALGKDAWHSIGGGEITHVPEGNDGNPSTCIRTPLMENPYYVIDLGKTYIVYGFTITHLETAEHRLEGFNALVGVQRERFYENYPCIAYIEYTITRATTFQFTCQPSPLIGRYAGIVTYKLEDMVLCEVEVMATDSVLKNLAIKKPASQSSHYGDGSATKAVDGDKSSEYDHRSCTHTEYEYEPWWKVDLGDIYEIYEIVITNRGDCCDDRLLNAQIYVIEDTGITGNTSCAEPLNYEDLSTNPITVNCGGPKLGRYVLIKLLNTTNYLTLCEVEVKGKVLIDRLPNVALGKPTIQISTLYDAVSDRAVDGNTTQDNSGCSSTQWDYEPWLRVDLETVYSVYRVEIVKPVGTANFTSEVVRVGYRADDLDVKNNTMCGWQLSDFDLENETYVMDCMMPILGRYVSVQLEGIDNDFSVEGILNLCEVKVFAEEFQPSVRPRLKSMFDKQANTRLSAEPNDVFVNVSLEICLQKCYNFNRFLCRCFDYESATYTCKLYNYCSPLGNASLVYAYGIDNYQRLRAEGFFLHGNQTSCAGGFVKCPSGECIHPYRMCDIMEDCDDGFDESDCVNSTTTTDSPDMDDVFRYGWEENFQTITSEPSHFTYFKDNIYQDRGLGRVRGETPPDWERFKSFSKFPEYSHFSDVLKLTGEEINTLGHQVNDFILQCSYAGEECHIREDFETLVEDRYGNCFQFNPRHHERDLLAKGTGSSRGLSLTLYTEQSEYLSMYGMDSGAIVTIQPPGELTFPQEQGFAAKPGTITRAALRKTEFRREKDPYGDCKSGKDGTYIDTVYGSANAKYSVMACENSCYQYMLAEYCGCVDTINDIDAPLCQILNTSQDLCHQLIYHFFQSALLPCECPVECSEDRYLMTISQSQWPSDAYMKKLLKLLKRSNNKTETLTTKEDARSNLIRLEVYFETLNYEETSEHPSYTWEDLLSDIGGTMGLYIGISLMTICEFVSFLAVLCARCFGKYGKNAIHDAHGTA